MVLHGFRIRARVFEAVTFEESDTLAVPWIDSHANIGPAAGLRVIVSTDAECVLEGEVSEIATFRIQGSRDVSDDVHAIVVFFGAVFNSEPHEGANPVVSFAVRLACGSL